MHNMMNQHAWKTGNEEACG